MIAAALDEVVTHLVANDISASTDPTEVNLPGVWVSAGTVSPDLLDGNGHVNVDLHMVVPQVLYPDVLVMLGELMAKVMDCIDLFGDIIPESIVWPDTPAQLPAYRATIQRTYTRTETP